jgi:hypothetical protein
VIHPDKAAGVSFVFGIPFAIAAIALLIADEQTGKAYWRTLVLPIGAYFIFLGSLMLARMEDVICVMVLIGPGVLVASLAVFLSKLSAIRRLRKKQKLLVAGLLPFALMFVESFFTPDVVHYEAKDSVVIASTPAIVWQSIIRVPTISDDEYHAGFFNLAGVPRPIEAKLIGDTVGSKRTGYFDEGLRFNEVITDWKPGKEVAFSITVDSTSLRDRVVDRHILAGGYFHFAEARYSIDSLSSNSVRLTLSASYDLQTKLNWYSSLWGDLIIHDFQQRLLDVLKRRGERRH